MKKPGYYLDDDPVSVVSDMGVSSRIDSDFVHNSDERLSREFERRLTKLDASIKQYFECGYTGSLFPRLFSCLSYVWCHHKDGRLYVKVKRTSVKK